MLHHLAVDGAAQVSPGQISVGILQLFILIAVPN
jgi:hypothetical protein